MPDDTLDGLWDILSSPIMTPKRHGDSPDEDLDADELLRVPPHLPILPLRGMVVFPMTAVPIRVGQPRSIRLIDDAVVGKRLVGLVASRDPELETPGPDDVYRIGTVAAVHRLFKSPDGTITLIMQGLMPCSSQRLMRFCVARKRVVRRRVLSGCQSLLPEGSSR